MVSFVNIQVSPPPVLSVRAILYLDTHPVILICSFSPPLFCLFCFQLSNGFSHYSLSSESHAGPVGAGPVPHCLPASRLLPRVTSVHLPDNAHYYTIGPGMFPSSQIPSWKVCVPLPPPPPPPHCFCAQPSSVLPASPGPCPARPSLPFTLCLLPHTPPSSSTPSTSFVQ